VKRQSEIDEETLKEVASITNGKFYRAKSGTALQEIYDEISSLEKTKIEVKEYYKYEELYAGFLAWGLILLAAGIVFNNTLGRSIP
jgi:Ca-activated chloride channel family protein